MSLRRTLFLHPDGKSALTGVEVEVARRGRRRIDVAFWLTGKVGAIAMPAPVTWPDGRLAAPGRADGLWRHTCFELFARAAGDQSYYEFNLSPSRQWQAYRFTAYREGLTEADEVGTPDIAWSRHPPRGDPETWPDKAQVEAYAARNLRFEASLDLGQAARLPLDRPWRLGLSAVIEERNSRISYWALAHPPGAPDFHHPDCFALELPAARPT